MLLCVMAHRCHAFLFAPIWSAVILARQAVICARIRTLVSPKKLLRDDWLNDAVVAVCFSSRVRRGAFLFNSLLGIMNEVNNDSL